MLPRRRLAPSRILSLAYRVFFWLCLVVLATWWSHRPHPFVLDEAASPLRTSYSTLTP
jgi:hypothetical protein